ncbi:putative pyroglutamyl peptidase type I [Mariannaea sp. PMI_226]|nr:putative pyroglutamyl peptidase type I [Mariannaea sp. PMI_226]
MGSQIGERELTILVTGFGPFREQYPVNPSWEIAKDLPTFLPGLRAKDPKSRFAVDLPPVRILVHPEPIRVNYKVVRGLVPSFWDGAYLGRKIDIALHIGMAGPRPYYCIERRGHRDGYEHQDVDGEFLDEKEERKPDSDWIWRGLPEEVLTDLDMEDVLERWREHSPKDMDLRISEDAGRYLCDFIYYSSMAHLSKQQRPRKVVFLHVPADASETSVTNGRELAVNLIRSIVESEVSKKQEKKNEGERVGS